MFARSFTLASLACIVLSLSACAAEAPEDEASSEGAALSSAARAGGRFETFVGMDGKKYFRLVANNHRILLRSEAYEREEAAQATMTSLVKAAVEGQASRFVILPAKDAGFYVNVRGAGASSEVIATTEVYSSRAKASDATDVIKGYLKGLGAGDVRFAPAETGKRIDLVRLPEDEAPRNASGNREPFRFLVRAANGEAVLVSEFYTSKQAAMNGINAVKNYGRLGENFEISETEDGRGHFVLKAHKHSAVSATPGAVGNHEALGFSETYASKANAARGAEAVRALLQADLDITDGTSR